MSQNPYKVKRQITEGQWIVGLVILVAAITLLSPLFSKAMEDLRKLQKYLDHSFKFQKVYGGPVLSFSLENRIPPSSEANILRLDH